MPQIYTDLKTGQRVYDDPAKGTVSATTGQIINAATLKPEPAIPILPRPLDTTNYTSLVDHGQGYIGSFLQPAPAVPPSGSSEDLTTRLNTLMTSLGSAPPSAEITYQSAYDQSGVAAAREEARRRQAAVRSAQAELAGIQAQIQGVVDKRNTQNLTLEKQAGEGQVVTPILNRQQQEVNRQAAIEALPLQALALAAQAKVASLQGESEYAQSALAEAQNKLDTAFQLKQKDAQNLYEYQKDARSAIYNFLTDEQRTRMAAKQKEDDRNFALLQNNLNNAQALSVKAMENGQADIASKITQLDPKSATFVQDLAALQTQIKPKLTGQSDFEQAFLREKGRLPTVAELLEFKKQSGEAGRKPEEIKDIFQKTQNTLQQYKNQGYTRQQVENEWKKQNAASGQDPTTVELPLPVQRALDNLYGLALTPAASIKTFKWYNPFTWFQ